MMNLHRGLSNLNPEGSNTKIPGEQKVRHEAAKLGTGA